MGEYREEAERRYSEGFWSGGGATQQVSLDVTQPVWFLLGPIGYQVVGLLRSLLTPKQGEMVLDVGGGRGVVFDYVLKGSGAVGVLTDIATEPLVDYKGIRLTADGLALPCVDGGFRRVMCSDFLEHLYPKDLPQALDEMARVTTYGGRVVLHTSCWGWYLRRLGAWLFGGGKGRLDRYDLKDGHRNRLTIGELAVLARRSGLVLERAVYYKHLFQPMIRWTKDKLMGRGDARLHKKRETGGEGEPPEGLKRSKGIKGMVVRILLRALAVFSALDILLFGKIPGGALVARFRREGE